MVERFHLVSRVGVSARNFDYAIRVHMFNENYEYFSTCQGALRTVSLGPMNSPPQLEKYINSNYNPALDDPTSCAPKAESGRLRCTPLKSERRALLARIVWSWG